MAANADSGASQERRRYEKPKIVRVPLRPEEAVLGFCKNANKAGPLRVMCTVPTACKTIGS